jgi:hypothetical protein
VEQMASLELSFSTFGDPALFDRVERLAFNALPAALTGDMWTHVYVQQANSVFAGVSHPHAESHLDHDHEEHVTKTACERASCSSPVEIAAGLGGGPAPFSEIETTNYFGVSHFPCCITNFPQGWPKFVQSTVFYEPSAGVGTGAVVLASIVPLRATVAQAGNATISIASQYPFGDTANISCYTTTNTTVVKVRIPTWANRALLDGKPVPNGSFAAFQCTTTVTTAHLDLRPEVLFEMGWGAYQNNSGDNRIEESRRSGVWTCSTGGMSGGDLHVANMTIDAARTWCGSNAKCMGFTAQQAGACGDTGLGQLQFHFKDAWGAKRTTNDKSWSNWKPGANPDSPTGATNAVGVSRGNLVFALHPLENRTVKRNYSSAVPRRPHAQDYEIKTSQPWNYALVPARGAEFNSSAAGWTPDFAFDDSGAMPFSIRVTGRRVSTWGFWRGSNITDVPPTSPVECRSNGCDDEEHLVLVPYGSTNIRISAFPWVNETMA